MVENTIVEKAYIGFTRAGIDVEKTMRLLSNMKLAGKIDEGEVGGIVVSGIFGLFVGAVSAVAVIGNREERGENVTTEKVICYGIMPLISAGIATFDALQD